MKTRWNKKISLRILERREKKFKWTGNYEKNSITAWLWNRNWTKMCSLLSTWMRDFFSSETTLNLNALIRGHQWVSMQRCKLNSCCSFVDMKLNVICCGQNKFFPYNNKSHKICITIFDIWHELEFFFIVSQNFNKYQLKTWISC